MFALISSVSFETLLQSRPLMLTALAMLGLIFGSFANALVWRLHAQEAVRDELEVLAGQPAGKRRDAKLAAGRRRLRELSMSHGRSMCSACRHPLAGKDLIPLFSWLWLRGKCRYCHQKIQDTPLLEAGLPLLFVGSYLAWPAPLQGYSLLSFVVWLVMLIGFSVLTAYDFRWYLLPDRVVWPLVALGVGQVIVHALFFDGGWPVVVTALWGVAMASGIFYALYVVSAGRWIGFGDVKLGIVLGLLVGGPLQGLLVIFTASLLGSLASLPLLFRRQLKANSVIPFGPFLMAATVVVMLYGPRLTDAFLAYFLPV